MQITGEASIVESPTSASSSQELQRIIERSTDRQFQVDGDTFDDVERVGSGNMGDVYLAYSRKHKRWVAVKKLQKEAAERDKTRFMREIRGLTELCHPHIVRLLDFGILDGRYYFSMEYIVGSSFAKLCNAPNIDLATRVLLLKQVADALHYAHGQGFLHRDVKPDNIVVEDENHAYLVDFGLAKHLQSDVPVTAYKATVGTPLYMSPEQVRSRDADIGPASDVYGLGAVLYEAMAGRPPHREATMLDTLRSIVVDPVIPPSALVVTIPEDLERICLKALAKDPKARYGSAGALAGDLDLWLRGEPLPRAAKPVPVSSAPPWWRRWWSWLS